MADKIIINGLKIFAYHGVNEEEKRDGQEFFIDAELTADLGRAGESDNLADTVNYASAVKTITRAMTENKFDLIEKAAQYVCDTVLSEHSKVDEITVLLKKPHAPVNAEFSYVAVKITRKRDDLSQ